MYHYIYQIVCKVTQRYYIGVHSTHRLNDGYFGSGKRLRNSICKHGKDQHLLTILEHLPDRIGLLKREAVLVSHETLKDPLCMNLKVGGEGGSNRGQKRSPETRAKISASKLGKPQSETHKLKKSLARIGKKLSIETKAKMSIAHAGKPLPPFSDEHRKKLSTAWEKRRLTFSGPNSGKTWVTKTKGVKVSCPRCGKTGGISVMKRWHFENCKYET